MTTTGQLLDRRREKAATAGAAADRAEAAVTDVDNQLKTIAELTGQQEQSLRRAVDEATRLKRALKAAAKRRAELVKERKKAVAKADRARQKAKATETKYDKEVLSELVRREKERDRAAARPDSSEPAAPEPAPERSTVTSVARSVAAKVTAAKAARTPGGAVTADPDRENDTTARPASETAAARSPR